MNSIIACLFGGISIAVCVLMAYATNKRLKSDQLEIEDSVEDKLYKRHPLTWITLLIIVSISVVVGYILYKKTASQVALIELGVCYFAVLAAGIIDLKTRTIPNYIPLTLIVTRLLIFVYELLYVDSAIQYFISSLIGGLLCALLLVIANKISKGGIGGGDIKLLASIGFVCGIYVIISSMVLALICCMVVSGFLLLSKKCTTKDNLPFGPFIYIGYLITCLLTLY